MKKYLQPTSVTVELRAAEGLLLASNIGTHDELPQGGGEGGDPEIGEQFANGKDSWDYSWED